MNFGAIFSGIGKIANIAFGVIKTALPILRSLRPAVDEVDQAFEYIEQGIEKGGVVADDFIDRNMETIEILEHVSAKGQTVFGQINELAADLRIASQVNTPDTITPEEAEAIGRKIVALRSLLHGWGPELDEAVAKMAAVKEE